MAESPLVSSSISWEAAAVRPPLSPIVAARPLLYVPSWLRLEDRPKEQTGIRRVGVQRGRRPAKEWNEWCVRAGGLNLYGKPNLRISWSEDVTVLVGTAFWKFDDHGNKLGEEIEYRTVKRYPAVRERWILEMWMSPESFGTPETWEAQWRKRTETGETYQLLPEFPSRGDYVHIGTFADPETGGYAEPSWNDFADVRVTQDRWRDTDPLERYFLLRDREEAEQAARDADVEAAAREEAGQERAEAMADAGIRTRVSLAGIDVPRRTE